MIAVKGMMQEVYTKQIEKDIKNILNEFDIEGLDEIIIEMHHLKNDGFYEKFIDAYKNRAHLSKEGGQINPNEMSGITLFILAYLNLSYPNLNLPPITDLITLSNINAMYHILEYLYYIKTGIKLDHEDVKNIYMSGLDERIIFALDKFDKIQKIPEPTAEFFKKLKKVHWQDNSTKKLYKKLNNLREDSIYGITTTIRYGGLSVDESRFLLLLAACSAVNNDRDKINQEDILKSHKTYLKLLKTDITTYKSTQKINDRGFLFCKKCNGYYPLEENESPDEFEQCQCGGELKYYESFDKINK